MRKTFFVVMFFAILNFEILFLVFSFLANLHFSSAQVPRDEKYKIAKIGKTENKIFRSQKKNQKQPNRKYFPDLPIKFSLLISNTEIFNPFLKHHQRRQNFFVLLQETCRRLEACQSWPHLQIYDRVRS